MSVYNLGRERGAGRGPSFCTVQVGRKSLALEV